MYAWHLAAIVAVAILCAVGVVWRKQLSKAKTKAEAVVSTDKAKVVAVVDSGLNQAKKVDKAVFTAAADLKKGL
jgi:hypothetical protein